MAAGPSEDSFANRLRKWLPGPLAYWITRQKNIRLRHLFFTKSREEPDKVAGYLSSLLQKELGEHYSADYQPPYAPWDQRLCLVPDSDFFAAVKAGKASIKTGEIETFEKDAK